MWAQSSRHGSNPSPLQWKRRVLTTDMVLRLFRCVRLFATQWTVASQAPFSVAFSRQEYWSGLPCRLQGVSPTQGWNLRLLWFQHWQAGSFPLELLGKPPNLWTTREFPGLLLLTNKPWTVLRGEKKFLSYLIYNIWGLCCWGNLNFCWILIFLMCIPMLLDVTTNTHCTFKYVFSVVICKAFFKWKCCTIISRALSPTFHKTH